LINFDPFLGLNNSSLSLPFFKEPGDDDSPSPGVNSERG
jgi:hypothetical protein